MNNSPVIVAIAKKDFNLFVNKLIRAGTHRVVGVTKISSSANPDVIGTKPFYAYGELTDASDLCLDYDVTVQSPRKYFQLPNETLLKYDIGVQSTQVLSINESQPLILIGVHPYDIIALRQMERVFRDSTPDPNYLAKWDKAILIGVNIKNVSPYAFAGSMNTATTETGFDLMLTDIGTTYAIDIGSTKGRNMLKKYAKVTKADDKLIRKVSEIKSRIAAKFKKHVKPSLAELPNLVSNNPDHPVWQKKSETCFSCGTCNNVCPTCYCFDILDFPALNLKQGERVRTWDGCLLEDFAKVATGENFRAQRVDRYKHRFMKKFKYLHDRFNFIACVGCGRCSSACLPDIADPCDVFNRLAADNGIKQDSTGLRKGGNE